MSDISWQIRRGIIPTHFVENAKRMVWDDLLNGGVSNRELYAWAHNSAWFPHLTWRQEIKDLDNALPAEHKNEHRATPQILLDFPTREGREPYEWHVDGDLPGRTEYKSIVGIPLTKWDSYHGGVEVKNGPASITLSLNPGDIVVMSPDCEHRTRANFSSDIRMGVYLRYLDLP